MNDTNIKSLTIRQLLSEDNYRIPIYQRNYDWGEKETMQFIEDIADYAKENSDKNYYIGSLVVYERTNDNHDYFETIDGQQRLTTLNILIRFLSTDSNLNTLMSWYNKDKINLNYDYREDAEEALKMMVGESPSSKPAGLGISDVYKIISSRLKKTLVDKNVSLTDFVTYLLNKVVILRIPVPQDTDLNHYFEIMNSRGEQLEKYEVLKAQLMKPIAEEYCENKIPTQLYDIIWEACSDMSSYVQMNMNSKIRNLLFGDSWDKLQYDRGDFDSFLSKYSSEMSTGRKSDDEFVERTLSELFVDAKENKKYNIPNEDKNNDGNKDRFGSVVNFPNFLLQTLKVMLHCHFEEILILDDKENMDNYEIILDDKRLIDNFTKVLMRCSNKAAFSKQFIMVLLKMRFLFDQYIIKRETYQNKEAWSLKRIKKYDDKANYVGTFSSNSKNETEDETEDSKRLRMLQAMFHVSAPTQIYKYWLNASLFYIYRKAVNNRPIISANAFSDELFKLACTYMLDRYLCEQKTSFDDIIFKNEFNCINTEINWTTIDQGCGVENFVFNFYDYLIWNVEPKKYSKFEFTYRTSVEHFYPQWPMEGNIKLTKETGLNDFGNLCLISRSMNSKFSNNMPKAKYENFSHGEGVNDLSLKLNIMLDYMKTHETWSTEQIHEFTEIARKKIQESIEIGLKKKCVLISR